MFLRGGLDRQLFIYLHWESTGQCITLAGETFTFKLDIR